MSNPTALVQKLWNYPPSLVSYGGTGCNMGSLAPARLGLRPSPPQNPFRSPPGGSSLRDDGLSYGDYVEQLTFLLFLKMEDEQSLPPFNRLSPSGFGGTSKPSAVPREFAIRMQECFVHAQNQLDSCWTFPTLPRTWLKPEIA